jgi:hypothetical protein
MAATPRSFADAARRAHFTLLGAFIAAAAWAQSNAPLDLRVPRDDAPPAARNATCPTCGEIRSIREVYVGQTRGAQAVTSTDTVGPRPDIDEWRVVGAAVYLPLGGGTKSDERWRFGAAGTPEMQSRLGETSYEITVQMDGGERRTLQRRDGSRFQVGQRVTLRSGELEAM